MTLTAFATKPNTWETGEYLRIDPNVLDDVLKLISDNSEDFTATTVFYRNVFDSACACGEEHESIITYITYRKPNSFGQTHSTLYHHSC